MTKNFDYSQMLVMWVMAIAIVVLANINTKQAKTIEQQKATIRMFASNPRCMGAPQPQNPYRNPDIYIGPKPKHKDKPEAGSEGAQRGFAPVAPGKGMWVI